MILLEVIAPDVLMGMGASILVVLSLFYYYERKNWKDEKFFLLEDIEKLKSNLGEAQSISDLSKELAIKEKEISSKEVELKSLVQEIKDTEEKSNRERESMQAGMQKIRLDMDADEKSKRAELSKLESEINQKKEEVENLKNKLPLLGKEKLDKLDIQIKEKQMALQNINDEYASSKEKLMEAAKKEVEEEKQRQLSWIRREIENERSKSIAEKERIWEERNKFRKEYEEEYSRKKAELDKIKEEKDYLNKKDAYEDELKYLEARIHARKEDLKNVETEYSSAHEALMKRAKEEVEGEKQRMINQMNKEIEKEEKNKEYKLELIRSDYNRQKEMNKSRAQIFLNDANRIADDIINRAVERINSYLSSRGEEDRSFSEEILSMSCGSNMEERDFMKEYNEATKKAKEVGKEEEKTDGALQHGYFSLSHQIGARWVTEAYFDIMAKKVIDNCLRTGFEESKHKMKMLAYEIYRKTEYGIHIRDSYLKAMIDVLRKKYEMEVKKQMIKETEAQERERIREEEKAQREYERAIRQAQKDEEKARRLLEETRRKMEAERANEKRFMELTEQINGLEQALQEAIARGERAKSMAEQTRHGYVYVISNIGSFGEGVYKIGLTRRLDPLDRVRELGDASVPFPFDVHAIIESEDAPALEAALHRIFDAQKMNKMNWRKEFFRVSLDEIEKAVKESGINATFIKECPAQQYRDSLLVEKERMAV